MPRRRVGSFRDPVSESAERLAAANQINKVLDTLSEREAGVISLRFGMTDGEPKTLDEIGKLYGVTRDRIRQIESKVLSKLRHQSRRILVLDYVGTEGAAPLRRLTDDESRKQVQKYIDEYIARLQRDQESFDKLPQCPKCPRKVPWSEQGRPRIYCSARCRQAAYRDRRAARAQ
jgi:hypothetical protein